MADIRISTDPNRLAERRAERKKKQQLTYIIGGVVTTAIVFIVLIVSTNLNKEVSPEVPPQEANLVAPTPIVRADETKDPVSVGPKQIADDGKTLWASPTSGGPISLAWLPTGAQLVLHVRPASLEMAGELDKVVAALGPVADDGTRWLESTAGVKLRELDSITVGLRPASGYVPEWSVVMRPTKSFAGEPPRSFRSDAQQSAGGVTTFRADDSTWIIASSTLFTELQELDGSPPLLRRELDSLLSASDDQRQITLLTAPSFLFGEGRELLAGQRKPLGERLIPMLPDEVKGICLSMNWDANFFAELLVSPTGGTKSREIAQSYAEQVADWPGDAEEAIIGLTAGDYGRRVVARFPAMLRALARNTRTDFERTHAVLRCYLPKPAGHSLLMASELMMAYESTGPVTAIASATQAETPKTFAERLAKPTSLSFERDTLEMAIKLLSDDLGIPITINGGDLQLDGITKNQSFGIKVENKPASDILVDILRLANPDKTATAANDPKQKLVYIVGEDETLMVTTRAAAAKRGDKLPEVFVE